MEIVLLAAGCFCAGFWFGSVVRSAPRNGGFRIQPSDELLRSKPPQVPAALPRRPIDSGSPPR